MDNSIRTADGTEVYISQIEQLFDEYTSNLENPDMIRKSTTFAGAMRYIYEQLFKPMEPQPYNKGTTLDTADIMQLDQIWGCYCRLCYKCGIRPTLLRYCLLTGIAPDTLDTWRRGEYRNASNVHSVTVKKWLKECESSIYDAVLDNSVGAIFAAKADFGWRETSPIAAEETPTIQHESAAEISARYASARLPEKPVFDD